MRRNERRFLRAEAPFSLKEAFYIRAFPPVFKKKAAPLNRRPARKVKKLIGTGVLNHAGSDSFKPSETKLIRLIWDKGNKP